MICATVVQWLGTNCGMGFLEEVLRKLGKKIVEAEAPPEYQARIAGLREQNAKLMEQLRGLATERDQARAERFSLFNLFRPFFDSAMTAEGIVEEFENLREQLRQAESLLASFNLSPCEVSGTASLGRFASIDDGEGLDA